MDQLKEINPYQSEMYPKEDDMTYARLFADIFRDAVRYNVTAKEWVVYDGIRWRPDKGGMQVESFAKIFADALWNYAGTVTDKDYRKFISRYGDRKKRTVMMEDARDLCAVSQDSFDQQKNLFNCLNCVIDLDTLAILQHTPEMMLSKVANVTYNPTAVSTRFEKFMREIMKDDEESIRYLQTIFGYAMTGENLLEECYILYGSTTRNGKSTLLETFGYLFGDYAMNCEPETLAQQREKSSRNASGDIARLAGCRFLHMSEPPKRMIFDAALLKRLLGRDKLTARFQYEREFEFVPVFKLFMNANYLPLVADDTVFASGRVKVIPFSRHFTETEQDPNLKAELKTEENLSGILNWLLQGLRRFHEQGDRITPPPAVTAATDLYRQRSDKIGVFFEECLVPVPGMTISGKEVYQRYEQWCVDNGFGIDNKTNFFDDLRSKGLLVEHGTVNGMTRRNVVKGYGWINVTDEPGTPPFQQEKLSLQNMNS